MRLMGVLIITWTKMLTPVKNVEMAGQFSDYEQELEGWLGRHTTGTACVGRPGFG